MDCKTLSPDAAKIFVQLKPFFKPDPWNNPQWHEEGIVRDNGIFDLRKKGDRNKMITRVLETLGSFVETSAGVYRKTYRSLDGFEIDHFGPLIKNKAELLLILRELDFQIETMDLVNS